MVFKIKARVYALDKNLKDLLPEMEKRGLSVDKTELSPALNGRQSPKAQKIVTLANEIVTEWERYSQADFD